MRTRPDIGLVIGDLLQLARFWLCSSTIANTLATFLFNWRVQYVRFMNYIFRVNIFR